MEKQKICLHENGEAQHVPEMLTVIPLAVSRYNPAHITGMLDKFTTAA